MRSLGSLPTWILLLSTSAHASGPGSWNYDRCDFVNGPAQWADLCRGDEQSPINLCGAVNLPLSASVSNTNFDRDIQSDLSRDGGVKFTVGSPSLTSSVGQVPQFLGRSSDTQDVTWNLEQAHFHWGRTGVSGEGSEHYMENFQYELEAHFVHYNSKYASVTAAVESGNSDALLVIGQMFQLEDEDEGGLVGPANESVALTKLGDAIESTRRQGQDNIELSITPSQLLDASGGFYTYAGSLTTPTCNPVVTWVNLATPLPVTSATLSKFQKVKKGGDAAIADHGNYRNLMPMGSRILYKSSDGLTSNPCPNRGVVEPRWEGCASGGASSLPAAVAAPLVACLASLAALFRRA